MHIPNKMKLCLWHDLAAFVDFKPFFAAEDLLFEAWFTFSQLPSTKNIHTLHVHYAHAAANLNSGKSKYAKVARVHYFCTIALWTSRAMLMRAWASRRVDLRECRVDLFSKRVIIFCWRWLLNLLKCLIYHMIKDKKVCLRRVWIRLTTAYLLCAQEFRQKNAHALQFWCLSNALTLRVHALDASKSQRACIILFKFTRKSNYAVINL